MTNEEIAQLIEYKINKASAELAAINVVRMQEPIDTVRWNTLYQLTKDLDGHINNLQWTLAYFQTNIV